MNLFIISDIHGMYDQFEQLLTHWNPEDKLVLLGDLVDRGPQSLEVIRKAMELKATYGEQVLFCLGNHDQMLLDFIDSPLEHKERYLQQGGRQTIWSFFPKPTPKEEQFTLNELIALIQLRFSEELDFLKSGQLYAIEGNVLLTHAGFNSKSSNLKDSTNDDFLWLREHYLQPNQTPYINVFGHTPTRYIHAFDDIWISEDETYIGIDGGCVFGGQLNALLISTEGQILQQYRVDNGAAKRKEWIIAEQYRFFNQTSEGILLNIQQKLKLTDAEMATHLNTDERIYRYYLERKCHLTRAKHQQIYDMFFDILSDAQKVYLEDFTKEPTKTFSDEDIRKLLMGIDPDQSD